MMNVLLVLVLIVLGIIAFRLVIWLIIFIIEMAQAVKFHIDTHRR